MTTVKRVLDSPVPPEDPVKRRGSKPGRKPLDTEAKNKRTAQNRAAQRAFRERKEQKMRELEDKVLRLERVQQQSEMESDFLRGQLQQLVTELQQYRPQQASDSHVLQYLAKSEQLQKRHEHLRGRSHSGSVSRSRSRSRSDGRNTSNTTPTDASENSSPAVDDTKINENMKRKMSFTFEYPRVSDASPVESASTAASSGLPPNKSLPFLAPTPSSSSGSLDLFSYNNTSDNQSLPKFTPSTNSNSLSNDFDFNSHFDEQVSDFCSQLNEACGTRECPMPKKNSPSSQSSPIIQRLQQSRMPSVSSRSGSSVKSPNTTQQLPQAAQRQHVKQEPEQLTLTNSWDSPQFGQSAFNLEAEDPINKWMFGGADFSKISGVVKEPSFSAESLPFIDTSLAFPSDQQDHLFNHNSDDVLTQFFEEDPTVNQLTTEESSYDPFRPNLESIAGKAASSSDIAGSTHSASESSVSTAITVPDQQLIEKASASSSASIDGGADLVEDVVPSRDGEMLKCSEVWDRVTAHPKYSDLDIDSLCFELRTKAKCSERGVVVNTDDVQKALSRHMT
ncbi:LAFA_0E21880g1_1 [Lachancea sp. 'fantastica']|nr:LAFA_0E21880g1_1 [Lachancea sp. 'fantastica']